MENTVVLKEEKIGLYPVQLIQRYSEYKKANIFVVYVPKKSSWSNSTAKVYVTKSTLEEAMEVYTKTCNQFRIADEDKKQRRAERNAVRKAETKLAAESIKVGDIFRHTSGYSMTFNDFYQVVSISGKRVKVVEIGSEITSGDAGYSGNERPLKMTDTSNLTESDLKIGTVVGMNVISVNGDYASLVEEGRSYYFNRMD